MQRRHVLAMGLVALTTAAPHIGCGRKNARLIYEEFPVEGRVTLAGVPLRSGMITLTPIGPNAPTGGYGGRITDGAFNIQAPAATHRVQVYFEGDGSSKFSHYVGESSDLRAEIVANGKNSFEFDLKPK